MRIGVSPYGSNRAAALEFARSLIDAGIDTLWLGDGMFIRPDFAMWRGGLESMTSLAWFAGHHPAARIGVTAAVLPVRDLDWLAREAATLDHLTDGRFVLAVTPGLWDDELEFRGGDPVARGAEFRARLGGLYERWAEGPLSPRPLTDGGPPIWLAGAEATMRTALDLGLPFQASRMSPDDLQPIAARWRDAGGGLLAHRIYVEAELAGSEGVEVDRRALGGSSEQILDGLARFAEMGVGDISLVLGHDDDSARATLDVLVDVLSKLSDASTD